MEDTSTVAQLSRTNPRDAMHDDKMAIKQSRDHNHGPFVGDMSSCC